MAMLIFFLKGQLYVDCKTMKSYMVKKDDSGKFILNEYGEPKFFHIGDIPKGIGEGVIRYIEKYATKMLDDGIITEGEETQISLSPMDLIVIQTKMVSRKGEQLQKNDDGYYSREKAYEVAMKRLSDWHFKLFNVESEKMVEELYERYLTDKAFKKKIDFEIKKERKSNSDKTPSENEVRSRFKNQLRAKYSGYRDLIFERTKNSMEDPRKKVTFFCSIRKREDESDSLFDLYKSPTSEDLVWKSDYRQPDNYVVKYRNKELNDILEELKSNQVVTICGEHGLGKSMIARHIASLCADSGVFWLTCEHNDTFSETILRLNTHWVPNTRFNTTEEIISVLNSERYKDKEWLIILDNCNNQGKAGEYVRDLNRFLERIGDNIKVIITSINNEIIKSSDKKRAVYQLSVISEKGYNDLWKEISGKTAENEQFKVFSEIVKKNTYITVLAASIVKNYEFEWEEKLHSIIDSLQRINIENVDETVLNTSDSERYGEKGMLYDLINALYDFSELEKEEKSVLDCLSLYPLVGAEIIEFEKLYGRSCRGIINDILIPSNWISFTQDKRGNKRIYLHPVVRNVVLAKRNDEGKREIYYSDRIKVFIDNLLKRTLEDRLVSDYECAGYADLIFNCFYFLHPFAEEVFDKSREILLNNDERFDPDDWLDCFDDRKNGIGPSLTHLGYIYTSLCEDTYLGDYERIFPTAMCVVWYLMCKEAFHLGESEFRDYQWMQGCGYSYLHTNSRGSIKEREMSQGLKYILYARDNMLQMKDSINKESDEYITLQTTIAKTYGNEGAYYYEKKDMTKARDLYLESWRVRKELHEYISSNDWWQSKADIFDIEEEILSLIATANENIALTYKNDDNPDFDKAILYYDEAVKIRREINISHNLYLRCCMRYMECLIRMFYEEKDEQQVERDGSIDTYITISEEVVDYYTRIYPQRVILESLDEMMNHIPDRYGRCLNKEKDIKRIRAALKSI